MLGHCILPNFLPHCHRQIELKIFGFGKHMTLVSYVQKKNQAGNLLLPMHNDDKIDAENRNKSAKLCVDSTLSCSAD